MNRDEFIAACRLLGRPIITDKGVVKQIHLRRWEGSIHIIDASLGKLSYGGQLHNTRSAAYFLSEVPTPYKILLDQLVTYLEETTDD